jgi:hypothetical protein
MSWTVEYTDDFEIWWAGLSAEQQESIRARVLLLEEQGPGLGRPVVDTVKASRHANMKELRCSREGALRVLFAFDPRRHAILLLGGDKTGRWSDWYEENIPRADDLFDEYIRELRNEGLI